MSLLSIGNCCVFFKEEVWDSNIRFIERSMYTITKQFETKDNKRASTNNIQQFFLIMMIADNPKLKPHFTKLA